MHYVCTWHTHMPYVIVFQKILSKVMNFGRFCQTKVDQSLWIARAKLLGWSKRCFVVKIWCTITPSCALQLLKEGFWSMLHERNPKFEFLHDFFEKFKPQWHDMCKGRLACHCAPLCQIWGHLNNATWINCPQVANWGWGTWSTHIVPQLREWIGS